MSIYRSTISAVLLGLALVTTVASSPASAHSWWRFYGGGHGYDRHGGHDYDRDGWYDNYGHYHRY